MMEFENFKKEFVPEAILSGDEDSKFKLPYIFFSSMRLFGLIVDLSHSYKMICNSINDIHGDFNSYFRVNSRNDKVECEELK